MLTQISRECSLNQKRVCYECYRKQKSRKPFSSREKFTLAEMVGFEPTVPCGTTDFESARYDHFGLHLHIRIVYNQFLLLVIISYYNLTTITGNTRKFSACFFALFSLPCLKNSSLHQHTFRKHR